MPSSDFYIPTTLTTSNVLIDTSSVSSGSTLMYKSGSGKFVATEKALPIGIIRMYTSNSAPSNYLICNGQSLSTTTYAALFNVIGYKYGGSGASFSLPNLSNTYAPYGSNANSGLTNSISIGASNANIDHTHSLPITQTSGAGNTDHGHNSPSTESAYHSHSWDANTQSGGSHAHNIQGTSVSHDHLFVRSNTGGNESTGNASGNHSHGITVASAGHNHNTSNNDGHGHGTNTAGSNHSSHNYTMTSNALTFSHTHTHNAATGIYFYIRYQ